MAPLLAGPGEADAIPALEEIAAPAVLDGFMNLRSRSKDTENKGRRASHVSFYF